MRGTKLLAVCVLAGALAAPAGVAAQTAEEAHKPGAEEMERGKRGQERLHLGCKSFPHEGHDGVACQWSPSKARDFTGYRLMRASRGEQPARVFTTDDRRETKALDRTVAAGTDYLYVVQALNGAGEVVAQSNPVRVHTGRPQHQRPAPALPSLGL